MMMKKLNGKIQIVNPRFAIEGTALCKGHQSRTRHRKLPSEGRRNWEGIE